MKQQSVDSHNILCQQLKSFTGDDVLLMDLSLMSQLKDMRPSNADQFGYLPAQIEKKNVIQ